MSPEEIKNYLSQSQRVCGHFYKRQVDQKENILQKLLINTYYKAIKVSPGFLKSSILFLLGFCLVLAGCNAVGKGVPEDDQRADSIESRTVDTIKVQSDTILKKTTIPDSTKNGL